MHVKSACVMFCVIVGAFFVLVPVVLAGTGKKKVPKWSAPKDELKKVLKTSSGAVPA